MRLTAPLLLAGMAAGAAAQQLSVGTASANAGQTAHLSVTLSAGKAQVSGLQFDLVYNTTAFTVKATTGAAAAAAGKSLATTNQTTGMRVLVAGFNQTLISDGSVTDLAIQVAANAASGNYSFALANLSGTDAPGNPLTVSGSGGSLAVTGSATNLPVITAVSNAASGQPALAANTWVSIYGSNFAPAGFTDDWSKSIVNGNLPPALDGVGVTVGGVAAYVSYLSGSQINVLTANIGSGSLSIVVTTAAGSSAPASGMAQQASPAFFPWPNGQPVATHADYSWAVKNGTFLGAITAPALPGETIILWGTGFGPTSPAAPTGVEIPGSQLYSSASAVTVTIGGLPASVYATVLAPGFAGLFEVIVTVPATLANGDYPLVATVSGVSAATTTLTVHN